VVQGDPKGEAMFFPRGEVVHKNLSTAYTDLPALLSTLKSEGFSGTLEVEFPEHKGALFIRSGEVINAEARMGGDSKRTIGPDAIRALLALSHQKDGVISLYQLAPERVTLIANSLQQEILFKGLSTDFTRLDRLLMKLREDKHDGFVEILSKGHQILGVLYLEEGEPVEVFTNSSGSEPSMAGKKSIPVFVENAIRQGALFNVYRTLTKTPRVREEPLKKREEPFKPKEEPPKVRGPEGARELIPVFQEILSKTERLVDGVTKKGTFLNTFKQSLVEHAEAFDFLDPFAGEFDYRDGIIRFIGEAKEKDFARGMVESIHTALTHLEGRLPKDRMFPVRLRAEIESAVERHRGVMKRLGVEGIISELFV
jgi:hypothetical protein